MSKLSADRLQSLAKALLPIVREAGAAIMGHYGRKPDIRTKADQSPVTVADHAANDLITARLATLAPDLPIISEEGPLDTTGMDLAQPFFLIDPLDGTKQFIDEIPEFTVNVALIENRLPRLGVIQLPALEAIYWTAGDGHAWRQLGDEPPQPIHCRKSPEGGATAVVSRSHFDDETRAYLARASATSFVTAGSSLKFCRLAEGTADIYPRFGPTFEWDIAAGHAILLAAGGSLSAWDGGSLSYGKPSFRNPGFVATGL